MSNRWVRDVRAFADSSPVAQRLTRRDFPLAVDGLRSQVGRESPRAALPLDYALDPSAAPAAIQTARSAPPIGGKGGALGCTALPSEPDVRISRIRLSG